MKPPGPVSGSGVKEYTEMILEKKMHFDFNNGLLSDIAPDSALEQLKDFVFTQQLFSAAIREVSTKLEILDDEFQVRFAHNPIHHLESRLKSPLSIIEKLKRKGLEISTESATKNLTDIAGIRVICFYVNDIYSIVQLLLKQDDVQLVEQVDYIQSPKESGYRSLHLVIKIPVFLAERTEFVPVEIQIRTIAMDFWASLEHQLKYKTDREVSDNLRVQLRSCADEIAQLDLRMEDIYHQLSSTPPAFNR